MSDYFTRDSQALFYAKNKIKWLHELSKPLFDHTKLTNFSYLRFNNDGTVLNLTTEEKWIQFRFEEKIKYKILFKADLPGAKNNTPYMYLWPNNIHDPLLGALHHYNIWNGCNIYISSENHIEVFSFATSVENESMQNFYLNNMELLKGFIIYFKEQLLELPEISLKDNLITTDLLLPATLTGNEAQALTFNKVYGDQKLKRIHLNSNFYITMRELECCSHLIKGRNNKAIAQMTKLSPRTVETHINNVKQRSNCTSKNHLIDLLSNNQWIFDTLTTSL